ncbi:hypothetical protein ISCGN_020755 [Ixodes scapularis]
MRTIKAKLRFKENTRSHSDRVLAANGFCLRVICFLSLVGDTFRNCSGRHLSIRAPNAPHHSTRSSASPSAVDHGKFLGPIVCRKRAALCNFTKKKKKKKTLAPYTFDENLKFSIATCKRRF